eukprot:Pgem_evm1s11490
MRRDVLFDGTLMWSPFVMQTLDMVRDNQHRYTRGPGYIVKEKNNNNNNNNNDDDDDDGGGGSGGDDDENDNDDYDYDH